MTDTSGNTKHSTEKQKDIRLTNLIAARSVADTIRTSLGPKGMDKMITDSSGDVIITNDGATILSRLEVQHPAAKMLVELSKSQDIEAGDGTTSVCVIAGALLEKAEELLALGVHPMQLSEAWKKAAARCQQILESIARPIKLSERSRLIEAAVTSLSSKVVSQHSHILAPVAVDAVLSIIKGKSKNKSKKTDHKQRKELKGGGAAAASRAAKEEEEGKGKDADANANANANADADFDEKDDGEPNNVDLREIRVVTRLGDELEQTQLVDGLVFNQEASKGAGGPSRIVKPRIALVQFQISPPKTDMENQLIVGNQQEIDRIARDEKKYILGIVKKILKCKCNVLLIQKSILRDAINILGSHYLAKKGVMVIKDIERTEMQFIARSLGCTPVATPDALTADKLGSAALAEEIHTPGGRVMQITGVQNPGRTVSVLVRGSNNLVLEEAERSLHDALCVVRSLVKKKFLIAGGGAPESHLSVALAKHSADSLSGIDQYCVRAFADALEVIPYTLAENAGLNPIDIVTKLRHAHVNGDVGAGIDVKLGCVGDMWQANVIQPLLVNTSAISLATEFVRLLLKVDDIVHCR